MRKGAGAETSVSELITEDRIPCTVVPKKRICLYECTPQLLNYDACIPATNLRISGLFSEFKLKYSEGQAASLIEIG